MRIARLRGIGGRRCEAERIIPIDFHGVVWQYSSVDCVQRTFIVVQLDTAVPGRNGGIMWDGDPTKFGLQGGDGYRRGVLGDLIKAGLLQQWHVLTDPLSGSSVEVMLDFKGGEVYELTARFGRIGEGVERRTLAELNRGGRIFGYARIDTPVDSPVVSTADVVEIMPGSDAQAQEEGVLNTNWLLSLFRSLIRDAGRSGPG